VPRVGIRRSRPAAGSRLSDVRFATSRSLASLGFSTSKSVSTWGSVSPGSSTESRCDLGAPELWGY
jgi:hypothetical protein